jgi:UV DNA damage endonuclease
MRIGYVCLTYVAPIHYKTIQARSLTNQTLEEVIRHNLQTLESQMLYNLEQGITFQRISSDLIPFSTSPIHTLDWKTRFVEEFRRIGRTIKEANIRVSMHPGQYSVLNSPIDHVVHNAILDLEYHADVLDLLGLDETHKIIIHVGGVYNDKQEAIKRFIKRYHELSLAIKRRLILEHDDVHYTLEDVMKIHQATGVPVVFDNLHHQIKPSFVEKNIPSILQMVHSTWKPMDGLPKMHYSEQAPNKRIGTHSRMIHLDSFLSFVELIQTSGVDFDLMLEVKDKNLSALKAMYVLHPNPIHVLEKQWAHFKYEVLAHHPGIYQRIRVLLQDKNTYPVNEFYHLLEEALETSISKPHFNNALSHMFGYVKEDASNLEKSKYEDYISNTDPSIQSIEKAIQWMYRLALKYEVKYLIESSIFLGL